MPDVEGKTKGPGTKTPDQAYKEGRSEDVQDGSLGADTGDPSPHEGDSSATPGASAEDVKRMDDAADQQNAAPGAAVDSQGLGRHGNQDVTDVESKQQHPRTPSDMGSR
jgi:hypothetical protein